MVRITFPNMGNSWVAFKALLEEIPGVEVVLPPPVTRKTIDLGTKYSPEFVCFPFKVNVGDFILTYEEEGVDTFVTALDCGPCRFGFYNVVQERILQDMGYNVKVLALDQADLLNFNWLKLFNKLNKEKNPIIKTVNIISAAQKYLMKAKYIADIEKLETYYRPREVKKGLTTKIVEQALKELDERKSVQEIRAFSSRLLELFESIEIDEDIEPLKIILTGEIHISLEPAVNIDLRKKLGEMQIEVHQNLSLFDWTLHKFHMNYHRKHLEKLSDPYIKYDIGGEAKWVIGEYILANQMGMDGFIHIYPFTCMPEVTARSIITAWDEPKVPAIFFSFDEQSGTEGMKTRLEAFRDLMFDKRRKHQNIQPEPRYMHQKSLLEEVKESFKTPWQTFLDSMQTIINFYQNVNPIELIQNIGKLFVKDY
ncbi:MAG: CoA protein activase [Promethearchaeota archaeon]